MYTLLTSRKGYACININLEKDMLKRRNYDADFNTSIHRPCEVCDLYYLSICISYYIYINILTAVIINIETTYILGKL